jgi:hypothetical protein|tara:strand:+ start:62 stop:1144 length:1083 start_codon:yes stop_codon:yes gene_type:complete
MLTSHISINHLIASSVALMVSVAAFSGDVPAPTSLAEVAKKDVLSPADEATIAAFVELHATTLETGDATTWPKARLKLLADVSGVSGRRATPLFREIYAEALMPRLKTILAESNTPRRIAAAQIAGGLGTDSAVSLLSRSLTPAQEPNEAVRVWTAASIRPLIDQPNVTPSRLNRTIRNLGQAAVLEQSWPVLRQQLETLVAATVNTRGDEAGQDALMKIGREQQAAVFAKAIERFQGGDLQMLLVIEPHMRHVQSQFLDQNDEQVLRVQARDTVPALSNLYGAVLANWDAIRADETMSQLAGRALKKGEIMIVLMDNHLTGKSQSSSPKYEQDIIKNDKSPIEAGKAKWGTVASGRAYK